VANRLCGLAQADDVLLSESVADALADALADGATSTHRGPLRCYIRNDLRVTRHNRSAERVWQVERTT